MNRIAAAGILRLALRWPALTVIVILSVIVARVMSAAAPTGTPPGADSAGPPIAITVR